MVRTPSIILIWTYYENARDPIIMLVKIYNENDWYSSIIVIERYKRWGDPPSILLPKDPSIMFVGSIKKMVGTPFIIFIETTVGFLLSCHCVIWRCGGNSSIIFIEDMASIPWSCLLRNIKTWKESLYRFYEGV